MLLGWLQGSLLLNQMRTLPALRTQSALTGILVMSESVENDRHFPRGFPSHAPGIYYKEQHLVRASGKDVELQKQKLHLQGACVNCNQV